MFAVVYRDGGGHDRTTVVDLYHFSQLMEEAVAGSGGGPRAYLAPAHAPVGADTPSFQPAIDARSRVSESGSSSQCL